MQEHPAPAFTVQTGEISNGRIGEYPSGGDKAQKQELLQLFNATVPLPFIEVVLEFGTSSTGLVVWQEDGYTVGAIGKINIDSGHAPYSHAIRPLGSLSAAFNSHLNITRDDGAPFALVQLDVLEDTISPQPFGIIVIGQRDDGTTVQHPVVLDGITGSQTVVLPDSFTGLTKVLIVDDPSDAYPVAYVRIDNVVLRATP